MSAEVLADLDSQIRIRQRIAQSLQHRLSWAILLNQSLLHHSNLHHHPPNSFKAAASHAIHTLESPCALIFNTTPPPPPRQKYSNRPDITPSFLYIKSSSLGYRQQEHDELYLLRCPQCSRTTFTTLQGLLNHARIAHRLEWGTHEDCVRECAIVQLGLDTTAGVEVGLGPAGILPGLRSIFRMAVGGLTAGQSTPGTQDAAASLTKMLGLHEDSPTLAPFLGKNPVRRGIKIYEQGDPLDVVNLEKSTTHYRRVPQFHRNVASQQVHGFKQPDHLATQNNSQGSEGVATDVTQHVKIPASAPLDSSQSRFYFTTRIVVADRSLWIPPDLREWTHRHHSYRWMISIHSPSYACELTTILKSMTVTPANAAESASFTDSPPYVVVGTSDRPFLAVVELLFNGIGASGVESPISKAQKIVLEHWVELDPVRSAIPTVGEEQIIDIELDKRTIIGAVRSSHNAIDSKILWNVSAHAKKRNVQDEEPSYSRVLGRLATIFPMVKETKKVRVNAADVPYKLVQTQSQLWLLNIGRRKAIEWRRAKALRDAYLEETLGYSRDNPLDFPSLSVGDVYVWLSDNGYCCRPPAEEAGQTKSRTTAPDEDSSTSSNHCHICGINRELCQLTTQSRPVEDALSNRFRNKSDCENVPDLDKMTKFPLIGAEYLITTQTVPPSDGAATAHFKLRDLLQIAIPELVGMVNAVVQRLAIPTFHVEDELENSEQTAIERRLGSYVLLSLAMRSFVRVLIAGGLEMSRRDMQLALREGKKKWREGQASPQRFLTPSHIIRGVVVHNETCVFRCLARIGIEIADGD